MITLPTTPEAFIAYQEKEIKRKLDDRERQFAAVVVELANISYQEGVAGQENTCTMDWVQCFYTKHGKNPDDNRIRMWESVCWWCDKAYHAGKETTIKALRDSKVKA